MIMTKEDNNLEVILKEVALLYELRYPSCYMIGDYIYNSYICQIVNIVQIDGDKYKMILFSGLIKHGSLSQIPRFATNEEIEEFGLQFWNLKNS